jgi:transcriptional regulator with XRE-family HTH domain
MTGDQLRTLREAHKLTQKALGAILGYGANYIARLERGVENGKPLLMTPRCAKMIQALFSTKRVKKSL